MHMSVSPVGLPIPATEDVGAQRTYAYRDMRKILMRQVRAVRAFGSETWWEEVGDPQALSWWDTRTVHAPTYRALRVDADGGSQRIQIHAHRAIRTNTRSSTERVGVAPQLATTYIREAGSAAGSDFYTPNPTGMLLALLAHKHAPAEVRMGRLEALRIHGPVVMESSSRDLVELEKTARLAHLWAESRDWSPLAISALDAGADPAAWVELTTEADRLLDANSPSSLLRGGPIWDAVLNSLMECLLEDGVTTAQELSERHHTYCDLIAHFTVDGKRVEELISSIVPRWMRFPTDLASRP